MEIVSHREFSLESFLCVARIVYLDGVPLKTLTYWLFLLQLI